MALINPNSKKFKNGMAKLYGFGAAIVILGALFKLMDWLELDNVNNRLSTEAIIFSSRHLKSHMKSQIGV